MQTLNRAIAIDLAEWKTSPVRRPLLIRGARQVGKTFAIEQFGRSHFNNFVNINFEERPEFAACFATLDVQEILRKIAILAAAEILPGQTLLFLDEIQECPAAIVALRYFFEKLPELHVIGAGSLLEFALKSSNLKMPVGRISSLFMAPLSFTEFLEAIGHERLASYLGQVRIESGIDPAFRQELEKALRMYLIVGGMPAVVAAYQAGASPEDVKKLQVAILQTYQADFAKYASTAQHKYLKDAFLAAPRLIGSQCKYSHINPHAQSRDLKNAVGLLAEARVLSQVFHSAGQGIPLEAQINPARFKLLFLDVGLMQRSLGLDSKLLFEKDIMTVNRGAVAEQYVGQQLLAAGPRYEEKRLHFWARESRSSKAEVDYLSAMDDLVLPLEVKAGKTGTLKSLRLFLAEHPDSPFGLRFSMQDLSFHDRVLSVPLYLVESWQRLADRVLAGLKNL